MNLSKKTLVIFSLSCLLFSTYSKADITPQNSVEEQFQALFEKSNNYQEYKVIKRTDFEKLWKNTSDFIRSKQEKDNKATSILKEKDLSIEKLKLDLLNKNTELEKAIQSKDEIALLGFIPLQKGAYNITICIIIGLLIAGCAFLFLRSQYAYKEAKDKRFLYDELSEEYKSFKARSHENEKKLARALQDERNKLAEHNLL